MSLRVFLFAVFALLSTSASATDYFICATGLGAKDGSSPANCYDGVTDASTTAAVTAGDTVYFCGTFAQTTFDLDWTNGTQAAPITYDGSCPGGTPVDHAATGLAATTHVRLNATWGIVQNFTVHMGNGSNGAGITLTGGYNKEHDNTIIGPAADHDSIGIRLTCDGSGWYESYDSDISGVSQGMLVDHNSDSCGDSEDTHILIDGHVIHDLFADNSAQCFDSGGSGDGNWNYQLTIQNLDCSGWGNGAAPAEDGIDLFNFSNVIVQDNYLHDGGPNGYKLGGSGQSGTIARRNKCVNVTGYCYSPNGATNVEISFNVADDAGGDCIFQSGAGSIIFNNTLINCVTGIDVDAAATIKSNVIQASGNSIEVATGVDAIGGANYISSSVTLAGTGTFTASPSNTTGTSPGINADYSLTSTSPLIDAGVYMFPCVDIVGGTCSGVVDIGAYQRASIPYGAVVKSRPLPLR